MKTTSLFSFACLMLTGLASVDITCESSDPPTEAVEAARSLQASRSARRTADMPGSRNETLLISTHVHVVEAEEDVGYITDGMLDEQMRVLNETFAPHGIQFVVQSLSHTVNTTWATTMRHKDKTLALRRGGYDELNLYFESRVGTVSGLSSGLCEFPVQDPYNTGLNGTSWLEWDGCHVGAVTMPGGPGPVDHPGKDQGKIATHEVGHWFGLFHVFHGFSCDGEGDFIDDTPAMLTASRGCNIGLDSCPDHPGLDPIHNYMDYSSDACQHEFTPLQEERMYRSFNELRKGR